MTTGRRPTPTAVKEARGKPGHRPLPEDEPKPEAVKGTKAPGFVHADAKKWWPTIARQLENANVLTVMDEQALAFYCELFMTYMSCRDLVDTHGLTMITNTGALQIRPEVDLMHKTFDRMFKILMEYGCTPASRTRVKVAGGPKKAGNRFAAGANLDEDE